MRQAPGKIIKISAFFVRQDSETEYYKAVLCNIFAENGTECFL